MLEIKKTGDGSHTIFVPELDEHYHSIYGAVTESEFIYINCGLNYCTVNPVRIFETGFGTGLNALLTAERCDAGERDVFYTTIEKYPLPVKITDSLNHRDFVSPEGRKLFDLIHSCEWGVPKKITKHFTLLKLYNDMISAEINGNFDLIYFDAFGPDKQPEMWTPEIFRKIYGITASNGILVTYSVKGEVKRGLRANGFKVFLLPGPEGKRHILRAVKI
jgi:tRNA U34 5-methylaminomethyl-2-thiouridine-forming methyltransferase MnmC